MVWWLLVSWFHGLLHWQKEKQRLQATVHHGSSKSYSKCYTAFLFLPISFLQSLWVYCMWKNFCTVYPCTLPELMFLMIRWGRRPKPLRHCLRDKTWILYWDGPCCFLLICCTKVKIYSNDMENQISFLTGSSVPRGRLCCVGLKGSFWHTVQGEG